MADTKVADCRHQAEILEVEIKRSGFFRITPGQVAFAKATWRRKETEA